MTASLYWCPEVNMASFAERLKNLREARKLTQGRAENEQVLVVVHTTEETDEDEVHIRIISARCADRDEVRNYEQVPH